MWIKIEESAFYTDSLKKGLKSHYLKIDPDLKKEIQCFVRWLRKNYWFPIEISCTFTNDNYLVGENNKKSCAIFIYQTTWDKKDTNDKILPKIKVATGKFKKQLKRHELSDVLFNQLFSIAHEITHYYQWYFYQFESRTDRSLEIEANRWGGYIVENFFKSLNR